jgi:hypothetical protein
MLEVALAGQPVRTIEIRARAKQAGISWATMRRAADALPVCAIRDGFGGAGAWWWALANAQKKGGRLSGT